MEKLKEKLELMYKACPNAMLKEPDLVLLVSESLVKDIGFDKDNGYVMDFYNIPVYVTDYHSMGTASLEQDNDNR